MSTLILVRYSRLESMPGQDASGVQFITEATQHMRQAKSRSMVVAAVLIAGCTLQSSPSPEGSSDPSSSEQPEATSSVGLGEGGGADELAIVLESLGVSQSTDPKYLFSSDKHYGWLLYSPLIGMDRTDTEPCVCDGLAESWGYTDDERLNYSVKLREGVLFHNGEEVTADDVVFSMARGYEDDAPPIDAFRTAVSDPSAITAVGRYEINIRLDQPSVTFEPLLTRGSGSAPLTFVVPKSYLQEVGDERFAESPIGSGPYQLVRSEFGVAMEFEAFDDYFLGRPSVDRISLRAVAEESTRAAMLRTGEVDIAEIASESAETLEEEGFSIFSKPGGTINSIFFHTHPELGGDNPLGDVRIREALALTVDVDSIVEELLGGLGQPNGLFTYGIPGIEPLAPHPYDPDQARALMEDAGYGPEGSDLALTFYVALRPGSASFVSIAETIAAGWEEQLGVRSTILPMEYATTLRPRMQARDLDVPSVRLHGISARPYYDDVLDIFQCDGANSLVCDPSFDALLEDLRAAATLAEFHDLHGALSEYVLDNLLGAPLWVDGPIFATNQMVSEWDLGQSAYSRNWRYLFLDAADLQH